jgi:hypothetical protein
MRGADGASTRVSSGRPRSVPAWAIAREARHRAAELSTVREMALRRQAMLAEQRIELRDALRLADDHAARYRTSTSRMLDCARQMLGLSTSELWVRYLALGGNLEPSAFARAMDGADEIQVRDYELISTTLNEEFRDAGFGNPLPSRRSHIHRLSPSAHRPTAPPGSG